MGVLLSKASKILFAAGAVGRVIGWDYTENDTDVEITTFDSTAKEYEAEGMPDGTLKVDLRFDATDTGQDAIRSAIAGGNQDVVIAVDGDFTVGSDVYEGNLAVTGQQVGAAMGQSINTSFTLRGRMILGVAT